MSEQQVKELCLSTLDTPNLDKVAAILTSASIAHNTPAQTPEWFAWKYWGSPFGPAVFAYAETTTGAIAGVVAFGRYELTQGDSNFSAALSYETFVHPAFRGQGLFTALMRLGMKQCQDLHVKVMFNFPNRASLQGFRKEGWIPVPCTRSFMRPSNFSNSITKLNPRVRFAPFVPDQISEFDPRDYEDFDSCLTAMPSIRSDSAWAAVRTPAYMHWRYRTFPMNRYVVVRNDLGWAMIRTGQRGNFREAQILDLFPYHKYDAKFLNSIAKRISSLVRPDLITITVSQTHPVVKSLWMAGFFRVPNSINFTYYPLADETRSSSRSWVLTATEFHTY